MCGVDKLIIGGVVGSGASSIARRIIGDNDMISDDGVNGIGDINGIGDTEYDRSGEGDVMSGWPIINDMDGNMAGFCMALFAGGAVVTADC